MRNYYITKNGASTGPFSIEQLKYQGILPETKVWYEGLPEWVEARTLAELSGLFPVVIDTPPPIVDKEGERLSRSTAFWRVMAVLTFVVMIGVAWWKFGSKQPLNPEPEQQNTVVAPIDPVPVPDPVPDPDPEELKKADYKENWRNYVSCYLESATPEDFGGFSNIKVRVKNDLPYRIEQLEIVVEYTLKNGEKRISPRKTLVNTEAKEFADLLRFPNQNRGMKLEPKVVGIRCAEIGLSYSEY